MLFRSIMSSNSVKLLFPRVDGEIFRLFALVGFCELDSDCCMIFTVSRSRFRFSFSDSRFARSCCCVLWRVEITAASCSSAALRAAISFSIRRMVVTASDDSLLLVEVILLHGSKIFFY